MAKQARTRNRRRPLDRDVVLQAAVELVERGGLEALSMRRLGAALGIEAMSLYYYVENKDALLDGIVETVVAGMDLSWARRSGRWQERLKEGDRAYRPPPPRPYPRPAAARPPARPPQCDRSRPSSACSGKPVSPHPPHSRPTAPSRASCTATRSPNSAASPSNPACTRQSENRNGSPSPRSPRPSPTRTGSTTTKNSSRGSTSSSPG